MGFSAQVVRADGEDGAYLDPPYRQVLGVSPITALDEVILQALPSKSNTAAVIANQSPVKSQGQRGTCSIFSAAAMLEGQLIRAGLVKRADADYSEEFLQYMIVRNKTEEGSGSYWNFSAIQSMGLPEERFLPYIGETWEDVDYSQLSRQRCGAIQDANFLKSCLLGHRDPRIFTAQDAVLRSRNSGLYDPQFADARIQAISNRNRLLSSLSGNAYGVRMIREIKTLLAAGIPLTLDVDFYYGAWNHRKAEEKGIPRDMNAWADGVVGYPAQDTVDRDVSLADPAGHSVLIVGYDDTASITTRQLMKDGSTQTLVYQGVYYFKNSWGSDSFGKNFKIDRVNYPGYGVLPQQYAHEFGGFYQFKLGY
jgi:hypothetical protein